MFRNVMEYIVGVACMSFCLLTIMISNYQSIKRTLVCRLEPIMPA